jgi:tRNA G18 (ribose-2'-O)-methylase SpoU
MRVNISDTSDSRVEEYRAVSDPALASAHGLFVAEGRHVVQRLIEDGRFPVRSVLLNEASFDALTTVLDRLPRHTPIYVTDTRHFQAIAGFNMHRGCLALAERPAALPVADVIRDARTIVVLEECGNTDNMGGVFRNAAAFGVDAVLVSPGSCDPFYRKAIRTSMAAVLRVPFARIAPWPEALATLRSEGFLIVALTPRAPAMTLEMFAASVRSSRLALLLGAEGAGLSDASLALADLHVRIPTRDAVDSLNLAVAAGIALSRLSGGPL